MTRTAGRKNDEWTDGERVGGDTGACWDEAVDAATFFEENEKIFQWDDSGAVEALEKAEGKLPQGMNGAYNEFQQVSEEYLEQPIDWTSRWSCDLEECAEVLSGRMKKNAKRNFTLKEQFSGSSDPVILGLPGPKDDAGRNRAPSLHLPLDYMPVATGWDDAAEHPEVAGWEDSTMKAVAGVTLESAPGGVLPEEDWPQVPTTGPAGTTMKNAPGDALPQEDWRQLPTHTDGGLDSCLGCPQCPSSYGHIIPSGWGDVQTDPTDPPVVSCSSAYPHIIPSGWEDVQPDPPFWGDNQTNPAEALSGWEEVQGAPLMVPPVPSGWGDSQRGPPLGPSVWGAVQTGPPLVPSVWGTLQMDPPLVPSGWGDVQTGPPLAPSGWGTLQMDTPLVASGWGDVQTYGGLVPSGWEDTADESQRDVQMHDSCNRWANYFPQDPNSHGQLWGNFSPSLESRHMHGTSYNGKKPEFYNKSFKYGYWKPKRGTDTSNETSGRRIVQRLGRPISTMYKVNHDAKPPRVNRWGPSKSQWQSAGAVTHMKSGIP